MQKAALAVLCLPVVAGRGTASSADASTLGGETSPVPGSVDGLNAPIWPSALPGVSPGTNPSSGGTGQFLSAGAQVELRSTSHQESVSVTRSDTEPSALFGRNPDTAADDHPHTSTSGAISIRATDL